MKNIVKILMTSGIILILGLYLNNSELKAQNLDQKPGKGFIDLNNDGINDNAVDSDGDGIPNCIDPDIVRQQNRNGDGNGNQYSSWYRYNYKHNFAHGYGYGPGDGTGNSGVGPRDGTGYGPGSGTGACDGTGPKGSKRGGRR